MPRTAAAPVRAVYGETLSLTTTMKYLDGFGIRSWGHPQGVKLYAPTAYRFQLTPRIESVLTTPDTTVASPVYTEAAEKIRREATSTLVLNSFAVASGVLVGSRSQYSGAQVTIGNTNSNASVLTVNYWNGTAFVDSTVTDGTAVAGATLGQTGLMSWTVPTGWTPRALNSQGTPLYWTQWKFSGALDASVTVTALQLRHEYPSNSGYGEAGELQEIMFNNADVAGIQALHATTETLDVTWIYMAQV